ncbi:MAG: aminoacyl-tRNA hydrolase [Bacilli bacterium]|nr:aminoacyl-tRNA hydrolase [Bacilli bacterium]
MKLIVGLGNPGIEYQNSRHNVGFMVVDRFVEVNHLAPFKQFKKGLISKNSDFILLKPQTYMNLSGESVREVMDYFKINQEDIIVIQDDLDIPLGSLRLRDKCSAGGHNGIKNIIMHLGNDNFKRMRIGVSKNKNIDTKDYVLSSFNKEEMEVLNPIIDKAIEALQKWSKEPFNKIMNNYNIKVK